MPKRKSNVVVLTRDEVQARVDKIANELLGVDYVTAYMLLDNGDLHGTVAAQHLSVYRSWLED